MDVYIDFCPVFRWDTVNISWPDRWIFGENVYSNKEQAQLCYKREELIKKGYDFTFSLLQDFQIVFLKKTLPKTEFIRIFEKTPWSGPYSPVKTGSLDVGYLLLPSTLLLLRADPETWMKIKVCYGVLLHLWKSQLFLKIFQKTNTHHCMFCY